MAVTARRHPGTAGKPWRTISHAAASVAPGDTVTIHGGSYLESVRVRVTGDAGRPIVFRGASGEKVTMDGNVRQLSYAFALFNKKHVKLDNLRFREIREGSRISGGVVLRNSDFTGVSRCCYDGRSAGYTPHFIQAVNCRNLSLRNCFIRGVQRDGIDSCPGLRFVIR